MCESKAQGGARCAGDTKKALEKATADYAAYAAKTRTDNDADPAEVAKKREELLDAVRLARFNYHTTPEGQRAAQADIDAQQVIADEKAAEIRANDGSSMDVIQSEENKRLQGLRDELRYAQRVRADQEAAREQYKRNKAGANGEHTQAAMAEQDRLPEWVGQGGNYQPRLQIGVLAVEEPFETTEYMETAAWTRTHEVQPGVYPVYLNRSGTETISVVYGTKITDQHLPPLFGGVGIGGDGPKDDIGKDSTHGVQDYAYSAPGAYVPGVPYKGGHLVLRQGVKMGTEPRVSSYDKKVAASTRVSCDRITSPLPSDGEERRRSLNRVPVGSETRVERTSKDGSVTTAWGRTEDGWRRDDGLGGPASTEFLNSELGRLGGRQRLVAKG